MNMFRALAGMTLFVIISGFGIIDSPAWGQPQIGDRRMAAPITAKEAAALEGSLSKNPDNLSTREQLIRYYFEAAITDRTPEVEEKREQRKLEALAEARKLLAAHRHQECITLLTSLQKEFPGRRVIGIDSTELIWGLGSFHCISQQEPV